MPTKRTCPPPSMTHEERQRLIRAPLTFRTCGRKSWGGVNLGVHHDDMDVNDRFRQTGADESYLRYGRPDDPNTGDL